MPALAVMLKSQSQRPFEIKTVKYVLNVYFNNERDSHVGFSGSKSNLRLYSSNFSKSAPDLHHVFRPPAEQSNHLLQPLTRQGFMGLNRRYHFFISDLHIGRKSVNSCSSSKYEFRSRSRSRSRPPYFFSCTQPQRLSSTQKKFELDPSDSDAHDGKSLVDRFLFVKTLKNFYEDAPTGAVMDTAYADSRPNEDFDRSLPVVVGLHDTPGTHTDLVPLLEFFAKLGCRTICPTLPGHGQTKGVMRGHDDIFCQSTIERAIFVNDFLGNLDIERVDLVVGVGASCYTSMALCTLQPEVFKSTALISPWPLSKYRENFDTSLPKYIQDAWDAQFLRLPLRLLLSALKLGSAKSTREKITLAYLLSKLDFGEVQGYATALGMKRVPCAVTCGALDQEMDQSSFKEILDKLMISQSSVREFDGVLKNLNFPGMLVFPDSDYEILTHRHGVLCAYLLMLLQRFYPQIKV